MEVRRGGGTETIVPGDVRQSQDNKRENGVSPDAKPDHGRLRTAWTHADQLGLRRVAHSVAGKRRHLSVHSRAAICGVRP